MLGRFDRRLVLRQRRDNPRCAGSQRLTAAAAQDAVEVTERRTPSTTGNLSAETLKALLDVQERDAVDPSSTPKE